MLSRSGCGRQVLVSAEMPQFQLGLLSCGVATTMPAAPIAESAARSPSSTSLTVFLWTLRPTPHQAADISLQLYDKYNESSTRRFLPSDACCTMSMPCP